MTPRAILSATPLLLALAQGVSGHEAKPQAQIDCLLPYHSAVDTGTVTRALNRMVDDTNAACR